MQNNTTSRELQQTNCNQLGLILIIRAFEPHRTIPQKPASVVHQLYSLLPHFHIRYLTTRPLTSSVLLLRGFCNSRDAGSL